MNFLLIGKPENRRVALFSESFEDNGFGKTIVLSYLNILKHNVLNETDFSGTMLRIGSPGESMEAVSYTHLDVYKRRVLVRIQ